MRLKHALKRGIAAAVIAGIAVSSGLPVLAETYYINDGSVTINATAEGRNNVTQEKAATQDLDTELAADEAETTVKGGTKAKEGSDWETATKNTVKITNNHEGTTTKVTLDNVTIETEGDAAVSVSGSGNVKLELDGKNTTTGDNYHAGIQKSGTGKLTIADDTKDGGSVTATGGSGSAGIGSKSGSNAEKIEITGGTVNATAGAGGGAAIGGGNGGKGTVTITGGNVTATGDGQDGTQNAGGGGAGIGGGEDASGTVTITGGTVYAQGGNDNSNAQGGAGIGGGRYGDDDGGETKVTISGGDVTAVGGAGRGSGIGSGYSGSNHDDVTVTITGGKVNASAGEGGVGIGNDDDGNTNVEISGQGTEVTASGGQTGGGHGIGGNNQWYQTGKATLIKIFGGSKVTATTGESGFTAVGIGGSDHVTINIAGEGTEVKATGNDAGIGTPGSSDDCTITIEGGKVEATGTAGVGIGGKNSEINIKGGEVTATGKGDNLGIGGDGSSITISGGSVTAVNDPGRVAIGGKGSNVTINGETGDTTVTVKSGKGKTGISTDGGTTSKELTMDDLGESFGHKVIVTFMNATGAYKAIHNRAYAGTSADTASADAHLWNEGETITPATCTESGLKKVTCSVPGCGATGTVVIPATGHLHTEIRDAKEATCTEDGYTGDTWCTDCGTKIATGKKVSATGHDFGEWVVTKEAACTEAGEETRTCTKGDATEKREIPAKGHTAKSERVNVKAATCTEDGYTGDVVCDTCGTVLEAGKKIPATGHSFGEWTVTKAATCTEAGEETRTCSQGDATEKREIPAKGHTAKSERVNVKAAICTEDGYTGNVVCNTCGAVLEAGEKIPATGHDFGEWTVTKEATCTEAGEETRTCSKGDAAETRETPATGHEFGEWVVTKEATVSEEGEETRTCAKCGAAETRAIEKLTPAPAPDPKPAPDPVPDPKPTPDPEPSVPDETPARNESEVTTAQPKLRLLDSNRTDILGNTEEVEQVFDAEEQTLTIQTDRAVADLTGTLELLDQMRAQGVKQIVLKTQNRTSVLLLDEICAVGGPDAEFSLTHNGTEVTLLVNGVSRPELIH